MNFGFGGDVMSDIISGGKKEKSLELVEIIDLDFQMREKLVFYNELNDERYKGVIKNIESVYCEKIIPAYREREQPDRVEESIKWFGNYFVNKRRE
jgi:hypothetical protein